MSEESNKMTDSSLQVVDVAGKNVSSLEVPGHFFEREKGKQAVHESVVAYLAQRRSGTAATKNRSKVRGSGAKPWRQKGTGRARAGDRKSPIWRGGGVAFGPVPRSYKKKINAKVRKLALRRVLTAKIDTNACIVIDLLEVKAPKTKQVIELLTSVGVGNHALLVIENSDNKNIIIGAQNLPDIRVVSVHQVNVYDLLRYKRILITAKALQIFFEYLK